MSYSAILTSDEVKDFTAIFYEQEIAKATLFHIYPYEEDTKRIGYIVKLEPRSYASKLLDDAFENKLKSWNGKFTKIFHEYSVVVGEVGDEDVDPNRVLEKGSGEGWTPLT